MKRIRASCLVAVALSLMLSGAQAKEKVMASCFYESGQDNGHAVSDFEIWNMSAYTIPKGTVVTFTTSGAPGKTFTAKPAQDVTPHDSFSSGGTEPMGTCQAWWFR